ncbi:MAG: DUF4922 domain-containing protein [Bacteroides sp.]|nr:DUF4922 domain-containing protein [Bacteroides sp.]MCM1379939.1 DUF4922 domain-containing protein [Bacteroides sp.]MCM1446206.1 DUF4922 domain-containing protein [Prevotella sp.]
MLNIEDFFKKQLAIWPEVAARYEALKNVEVKNVGDHCVQFNPARAVSTAAKVDAASIAARPCFLCAENRPKEQIALEWGDYEILVNPFPIFPGHLTIAAKTHIPQTLERRFEDMQKLSRQLPGYTLFFNGAKAGASAPDHMHFQAVPSEYMRVSNKYFSYKLNEDFTPEFLDPMINIVCTNGGAIAIPRTKHRPDCYGDLLVSPASIDLCGTLIAVRREDFDRLDSKLVDSIIREVTFQEPIIYVELCSRGPHQVVENGDGTVTVKNLLIGDNFHWERLQRHTFSGSVIFDKERAYNRIPIEEYLKSVISSEMSANSSFELLKTHAIISRSWVWHQMRINRKPLTFKEEPILSDEERKVWYDGYNHIHCDVCSDDHCQRYQGIDRINDMVAEAVEQTRGMMLTCNGEICDARFSKCCGGAFERFETCWDNDPHPYLLEGRDSAPGEPLPDLTDEDDARRWILSRPKSFCGNVSDNVLNQVLNNFDRETTPDFYRWTVRYSQLGLSALIKEKLHQDLGMILELRPLKRGVSGRIFQLEIVGEKASMIIGKELLIRSVLSPTHLYSSAFVIDRDGTDFVLHGAGWGHGVGLCQIGAAQIAELCYSHQEILAHYYPGTTLERIY